jgi:hypothetical protein
MDLTGGCLCGAVRYKSTGAPSRQFVCHCSDCKRSGGSAFHVGIAVPRANFAITSGELRAYVKQGDSGRTVTRSFCPNCGSGVINEPEVWPDHVVIKVGTLDEPAAVAPALELYAQSRMPWVSIAREKQT